MAQDPSGVEQIKTLLAFGFIAVIVIGSIARCEFSNNAVHGHGHHDPGEEQSPEQEHSAIFYSRDDPSAPLLLLEGGSYQLVSVPTMAEARRRLHGQRVLQMDFSSKAIKAHGSTASAILLSGRANLEDSTQAYSRAGDIMMRSTGPSVTMHQPNELKAPVMIIWVGGPSFEQQPGNVGRVSTKMLELDPVPARSDDATEETDSSPIGGHRELDDHHPIRPEPRPHPL